MLKLEGRWEEVDCRRRLAMMIEYGAMPANMIRIFLGFSLATSSAIIFRSFESLGEKYDSSMLNLNVALFSLYVACFVLIPARCFVFDVLSFPEILSVFSTTVVIVLFCFRNFLALSFFIIHKVFLGNFRMAMLPSMSWGMRLDRFAGRSLRW